MHLHGALDKSFMMDVFCKGTRASARSLSLIVGTERAGGAARISCASAWSGQLPARLLLFAVPALGNAVLPTAFLRPNRLLRRCLRMAHCAAHRLPRGQRRLGQRRPRDLRRAVCRLHHTRRLLAARLKLRRPPTQSAPATSCTRATIFDPP